LLPPAATETVVLCSAIVTLTISATASVVVFEVAVAGVPPID
jgi:hypothetical protein